DHADLCGPGRRAADNGEVGVPESSGDQGAGTQGKAIAPRTIETSTEDDGNSVTAALLDRPRRRTENRPAVDGSGMREVRRRQAFLPDSEPERADHARGGMFTVGICQRQRSGLLP